MTTTFNANSTGLVETIDNSGLLQFQTNGTAAISMDASQNVTMNGTGYVQVPVGTTAQRPAAATNGMIRYNTDLLKYEAFVNSAWTTL